MERNQGIVVAVVVAALALFGLKVWSDRSADSDLTSDSQVAAQRLARAGGLQGSEGSGSYEGGTGRAGRPGEHGGMHGGGDGSGAGGGTRIGPDGRPMSGSADIARAGAPRLGSGIGVSGSGRGSGGGSGASITGGGSGENGQLGPKVQQKQNLVDFLSSKPSTEPQLAAPTDENGEDVTLKVDKVADIHPQGGQDQDVHPAQDGDGIEITDRGKIEFPNYATGDAASVSFQLKPEWSGSDQTDNALLEIRQEHEWNNRLELVKNGEFLRFIVTDSTGHEADISVRISDWAAGDEHDIQFKYGPNPNGNGPGGQTQLYIDGRLAGTNEYPGPLNFAQGTPMFLGGDHSSSNYSGAQGTIRDFRWKNALD